MNKEQFFLEESYWYILVNDESEFNAVVSWCSQRGFERVEKTPFCKDKTKAVAHDPTWKKGKLYQAGNITIRDMRSKEIKVEFENIVKVKTAVLPCSMSDNTTLIKVRELREEINNMQKKLEELEKSVE